MILGFKLFGVKGFSFSSAFIVHQLYRSNAVYEGLVENNKNEEKQIMCNIVVMLGVGG